MDLSGPCVLDSHHIGVGAERHASERHQSTRESVALTIWNEVGIDVGAIPGRTGGSSRQTRNHCQNEQRSFHADKI